MNQTEILEVLEENGAVLRGHFKLSSGRHSDLFVQKFRVLEHPSLAERFGRDIAALFHSEFDAVASPAVGALVLGFATALAGDARFIFAERVDDKMTFRRGFAIAPHERVLVVEDVVTTGGSAREVVDAVRAADGDPVGVGTLIDRGDPARPPHLGVPLRALVTLEVASWDPDDCPLCANGEPLDDPGSRRL
ncbi:MAG TPA: orotate phosphoribosyltransferase [Actinomycetota bacterium]